MAKLLDIFPRTYIVNGLNPQPWSVSMKVKRGALDAYQRGLKEELVDQVEGLWPPGVPIRLYFEFWRQLEDHLDYDRRRHILQLADATNLQKSTEDALQGVLFTNDRYVSDVHSRIRAQGVDVEPKIVIVIGPSDHD